MRRYLVYARNFVSANEAVRIGYRTVNWRTFFGAEGAPVLEHLLIQTGGALLVEVES